MSTTIAPNTHSNDQLRHDRQVWLLVYVLMIGGGFLIAAYTRRRITEPFLGLSLGVLLVLMISWTIRPRATLYATIFLTAVSDISTVAWFPFAKNLSSRESISFVADALTISPLDISLMIGFTVTTVAQYAATGRLLPPSPLTRPILVFTGFVILGFARGLIAAGSDSHVAVLEGRPLFYLLLTFGITINICTTAAHFRTALWWALAGIMAQTVLTIHYFSRLDPAERDALESLNEHGSTLGHNLVIVTFLGVLLLRVRAPIARWVLPVAVAPTLFVVLIAERRAGVASLAVGGVLLLIVLFWRNRRRFWVVAPIMIVITLMYLAAFWTVDSSIGFPAQAIKSIIAPGAASAADQNSDLYRLIEAYDLNFTIHTDPLFGIGFGRPFYRPIPLPDIGLFGLNAFIPHNSVLWIWMKTGFGGFAAMFYLFAKTIVLGARHVRQRPSGIDVVVTQTALLFVAMFLVYSYVDISWDARNMVLLGLMCAICAQPVSMARRAPATDQPADTPLDLATRTSPTTAATDSA